MKSLNELYNTLQIIEGKKKSRLSPIPIFSFEGLPGAGKTTQIKLVSEVLTEKYGKICYIDLPTQSPIGKIMKSLYLEEKRWKDIRISSPWFNPIMISTDLRIAIDQAIDEGAKYVIMSRGILSTYYYNLDAYDSDEDKAWDMMQNHMKAFYMPTAIIFMDIPEEVAYERVVKRNRGPLRRMDKVEEMRKDKVRLQNYLDKLANVPTYYINAVGTEEEVTKRIVEKLEDVLKIWVK